jgi:ParB family transcriptional regulator, chromosome partitioning protein
MTRNALGKGLSALIREPEPKPTPAPREPVAVSGPREIDIDLIDPNPRQPRSRFREESLEELAQSIRATGIIQPVVVRPLGERFQLIAGERRWRAAQRAGLHRIPAVTRDVSDHVAMEMTLVENLQREDLNPVEEARAFESLLTMFNLTQEQAAERTGKDRATIANSIRLLKLDGQILAMIEDGRLTGGHGRALLAIEPLAARLAAAKRAAEGKLTVRALEKLAARGQQRSAEKKQEAVLDPNTRAAIEELERELGTKVILQPPKGRGTGRLIIEYHDARQLEGIYERVRGNRYN